MSGPFTEEPHLPEPSRELLDAYERQIEELMREREERINRATEGPDAWENVERLVDQVHLERVQRIIERNEKLD